MSESMTFDALQAFGWHPFFAAAFAAEAESVPGAIPGRVLIEHPGLYRVQTPQGERLCEITGRLRHAALSREDLPAVGDWVLLQPADASQARIAAVLPRRSAFVRRQGLQPQVVAANLDTLLLVSALNQDLNLRRIERYLALAWESGARPVIVLNKADLLPDAEREAVLQAIDSIALGTDVVMLSASTGEGLAQLAPWLQPGNTLALLGSSGVGKSTLVNALGVSRQQRTQAARSDDDRGRHTTTHRELFVLPGGALLIDTPGMRELALWQAGEGLDQGFAEIEALLGHCRYRNCRHEAEADCALQTAVADGTLEAGRLQSWFKLQREAQWFERKVDPVLQANTKKRWKKITQSLRRRQSAEESMD